MAKRMSVTDLLDACDSFPYQEVDPERHARLMADFCTLVWPHSDGTIIPIGYMPLRVLESLKYEPTSAFGGSLDIQHSSKNGIVTTTVSAFHHLSSEPERTRLLSTLMNSWHAHGAFNFGGWRNELWPVYGPAGDLLFSMERAAMGLFGSMRYGVHMTAYIRRPNGSGGKRSAYPHRFWVPRRAAKKASFPGMLDNTVAGGLTTGEVPRETLLREADEEASLPEWLVRERVKEVGTVTYIYVADERSGGQSGHIHPECQWVYDLELPDDGSVVPTPKDGEVESFSLCTVEEVQEQLARGEWKPNCAVIMLDFFVRHGILTPEMEPACEQIKRRLHRRMPFPGPHQPS